MTQEAMILPTVLWGSTSPYPTVVAVVTAQYSATPMLTCWVNENNAAPITRIVTAVPSSASSL